MKRRILALVLTLTMVLALAACGSSGDTGNKDVAVSITIFNSKMDIQSQMEEAAAKYGEEKGINIV